MSRRPQLTMFHANVARLESGRFIVDRKFLTGMERMVAAIQADITTVHPQQFPTSWVMDAIEVPIKDLPYRVEVVQTNPRWRPLPTSEGRVRSLIAASSLVYYEDFDIKHLTRDLKVPELLVLECDFRTQVQLAAVVGRTPVHKWVRGARAMHNYASTAAALKRAVQVQCNGYPAYDEVGYLNPEHRLLYLDSRMVHADVIQEARLQQRLASLGTRPLKLLFSGRYEAMKGTLDAVRVGVQALGRGLNIEMHFYGQGVQADAMRALAEPTHGKIVIHDAVPYPELVEIARNFDLFVCCHVQSDPSCTYLESFGAGLPVVGYANRMWRGLQAEAGCGFQSPMGKIEPVVDDVARYATNPALLAEHAHKARAFALDHCFEVEFKKRTDDINRVLASLKR